jgi:filamentous hemagglutinin family protein
VVTGAMKSRTRSTSLFSKRKSGRAFASDSLKAIGAVIALMAGGLSPAQANPAGGTVVAGQGQISTPSPTETRITQSSQTLILNWESFNIANGERTRFLQPNASALAVNRIGGSDPSQILGSLTANGRIVLINPNGMLFGETANVNVGSLAATTHDLSNEDVLAGRLNFNIPGNPIATVENQGAISANGGSIAFVAPGVSNSGTIVARLGTVSLAGASKFTLDFEGDNLISFPVDAEVIARAVGSDGKPVDALVSNSGTIEGSTVVLSARSAGDIVANAINIEGSVIARTAHQDGDDIVLGGFEIDERDRSQRFTPEHRPFVERAIARAILDQGGTIVIDGGTQGLVNVTGTLDASSSRGGTIRATGEMIYADGLFIADGIEDAGGSISIDGKWVSIGGSLSANGATSGGSIEIDAGGLSFAGALSATGDSGAGGKVDISVLRKSLEFKGASIDVSGASGGSIRNVAGQQITTSATYAAVGRSGAGGKIDLSAPATKLLSPTLNASGFTSGGLIRIGGEYQGGKSLTIDELPNASTTVASDGTKLYVDVLGPSGAGGTTIVWSDVETVFLGSIFARPGTQSGAGGFVEISSGELLQYAGHVETGIGNRQGTVLFDPKNINIVDVAVSGIQLQLVLGYNFVGDSALKAGDFFGNAISLDGTRMAVGALGDDGGANNCPDCGAIYLFTFDDLNFGSGTLSGIIGDGYTGGKNIYLAGILQNNDFFGSAVSLDGTRLAVGAAYDRGADNSCVICGAVYLFNFADDNFSGGVLTARIGHGYTGSKNINLSGLLEGHPSSDDLFGMSVSLDGDRLAVGAVVDDGAGNSCAACGAVYLFNFTDAAFSGGTLVGRIGSGYSGPKDINLAGMLDIGDQFGMSVSLDGDRLAVGAAAGDDGEGNSCTDCGAVYLFNFTDAAFSSGALVGRIGSGYSGPKDINLAGMLNTNNPVGENDQFGTSVSLDGDRLAVGAAGDHGEGNSCGGACGAVYLFNFTDAAFSGGALVGRIGSGYSGLKDINLAGMLDILDFFGISVSLDGDRLAVGAHFDAAVANTCSRCGAVYLFTFATDDFSGGLLNGIIGAGYAGGNNIDVNAIGLSVSDAFGQSVSLNGLRLAVGAPGDDGFNIGPSAPDSEYGAVYLYTFDNANFSGASLEGIIGVGYTGGSNFNVANYVDPFDRFGHSVSLDGNQLIVGAPYDDGSDASGILDYGAVYLFTFANAQLAGAALRGIIGEGYAPTAILPTSLNISSLLDAGDLFGTAASLDANRLAVGAPGDDGFGNSYPYNGTSIGAVHLFSFSDNAFSGGTQPVTIGANYSDGNDFDLIPDRINMLFGTAVSLDGNHLAVGAPGLYGGGGCNPVNFDPCLALAVFSFSAPGFSDIALTYSRLSNPIYGIGSSIALDGTLLAVGGEHNLSNQQSCGLGLCAFGAVSLFSFTDASFSAVVSRGRIGANNVSGPNDFDVSPWFPGALSFGASVSLDGGRLAVGQAAGGPNYFSGSVALFLLDNSSGISDALFNSSPGLDTTISKNALLALLNSGQNVILQANNDITLNTDLTVGCVLFCDGGDLTLQAGRSIILNGSIFTDNGDLSITANSRAFDGVVDAYRESGPAVIEMAANTSIDVGHGHLFMKIEDGAGLTFSEGGDISLQRIFAGSLEVSTMGGTGRDILLNGMITIRDSAFTNQFLSNNDIRLNADIVDECLLLCAADNLLLQAARSILLNGSISTHGGDLTMIANMPALVGFVASQRGTGAAEITMAANTEINAGAGNVIIQIAGGTGHANRGGGDMVLQSITAGSIAADNLGGTGRNLVLNGPIFTGGTGLISVFEANNDIMLNADLAVNNPQLSAPGGDIVFQAGRSITLAGSIESDGGDITVIANSGAAIGAYRDPGPAFINMVPGTHIDAGTGRVQIRVDTGGNNPFTQSGHIVLQNISAEEILIENLGPSVGDIFVNAILEAEAEGSSIIVATGHGTFINIHGPGALDPGKGRFLIYTPGFERAEFNGISAAAQFGIPYNPADPDGTLKFVGLDRNLFLFERSLPEGFEASRLPPGILAINNPTFTNEWFLERRREHVRIESADIPASIEQMILDRQKGATYWQLADGLAMYAALADAAYSESDKSLLGFTRLARVEGANNGLTYSIYERDGKIIIAFEGTYDPTDAVLDLLAMMYGKNLPYADEALKAVQEIIARYGKENVSCVGHSLGGALCGYVAAKEQIHGVAFNQLAVDHQDLLTPSEIAGARDFVLAVNMFGDPASHEERYAITLGTKIVVPPPADDVCAFLGCHGMTYLSDALADTARSANSGP